MSCSAITLSSTPKRPRSAPWIFGCSVFTRPPMISGKPVTPDTSVTLNPASRRACAVPPVEIKATPSAARPRASSTRPVLSDTLSKALVGGCRVAGCSSVMTSGCAKFEARSVAQFDAQFISDSAKPTLGVACRSLFFGPSDCGDSYKPWQSDTCHASCRFWTSLCSKVSLLRATIVKMRLNSRLNSHWMHFHREH